MYNEQVNPNYGLSYSRSSIMKIADVFDNHDVYIFGINTSHILQLSL